MRKALLAILLAAVSLPLLAAVGRLPRQGGVDTPSYTRVVPRYLERGPREAGGENIVTDIVLNYRAYDTFGEVTVVFTALVAVIAVLLARGGPPEGSPAPEAPPVSQVVGFVVRILAPFIALFSVYLVLLGHHSPGGGFQGGTMLGGLLIALSLVLGSGRPMKLFPGWARPWQQAAGVLVFLVLGAAGIGIAGSFLAFPGVEALPRLNAAWFLALEAGIGIGSASIVALIFWAMEQAR